MIFAPK